MSDQPIRDRQPLDLPAGKRDGQIEIGCLEMLGQGHGVTDAFEVPAALYGIVLLMAGVAYFIMERQMVLENGPQSMLAEALGRDRKAMLSMVGYIVAIVLAFVSPRLAELIYALVAAWWIVPDRRIASRVREIDLSG